MFKESRSVALNFSDYSIEALELVRDKGSLRIKSRSRVVLQSGIIEDGRIIDADRLRESVRQLLAQAQPAPISAREVVVTLPESKVFVQTLRIEASVPRKKVAVTLLSRATESLPIDSTGMAYDYRFIRKTEDGEEYVFAATQQAIVQEYVSFFQSAQLKVSLMTMESLALAAAAIDEHSNETVLLLDIGSRTSIASIFVQGELVESININIAGNAITAALAEKLKISTAEAEERKIARGLKPVNGSGDGSEMLIIQGQVQPLKDELMVFIKFYERKTGTTISRVLLAGGSAGLAGLDEYLSSNIGLPVNVASPLPLFAVENDAAQAPTFMVALGLARLALGDRKAAIDFVSQKSNEVIPTQVAGTPGPIPLVTQTGQKARTRSRTRTLILLVVALIIVNLLGWLLWMRYGAPQQTSMDVASSAANAVRDSVKNTLDVIVRPFAGPSEGNSPSLGFTFVLDLTPDTLDAGAYPAKRGTIVIDKAMSYDDGTVAYVTALVRSRLPQGTEPTEGDIRLALQDHLADRLWEESESFYYDETLKESAVLLTTPVSRTIKAADPVATEDNQEELLQIRMSVEYAVLLVTDVARFQEFESDTVSAFTAMNAGAAINRRTYTYRDATDRVEVTALYTFITK